MNIAGKWFNELNSSMTLRVRGNVISGTYHNHAGQAAGAFPFVGMIDSKHSKKGQTVAWVVNWFRAKTGDNFNAATAWAGQYQLVVDQATGRKIETITTEWLLVSETSPHDDWTSTKIGHDVFKRTPPARQEFENHMTTRGRSHPTEAKSSH